MVFIKKKLEDIKKWQMNMKVSEKQKPETN